MRFIFNFMVIGALFFLYNAEPAQPYVDKAHKWVDQTIENVDLAEKTWAATEKEPSSEKPDRQQQEPRFTEPQIEPQARQYREYNRAAVAEKNLAEVLSENRNQRRNELQQLAEEMELMFVKRLGQ